MTKDNGFEYISSKNNEKVKGFAKLSSLKYRKSEGLFLAEGVKLALEATGCGCARCLLVRENSLGSADVKNVLDKSGGDVIKYILADEAFAKVSTESAPQGVIAVCAPPRFHSTGSDTDPASLDGASVLALDGVRDPGNLGTVIRSSLAFGTDVLILGDCADVYNPKTVRATMGALFRMRLVVTDSLPEYLSALSKRGRRILGAALDERALTFGDHLPKATDVPVVGNEGHGLSAEVLSVCDDLIKIPMNDGAESLNAGVASSIIMWEYSKLRRTII